MRKNLHVAFCILIVMCCSLNSIAQNNDTILIEKNEKGIIRFGRFAPAKAANRSMTNAAAFLRQTLNTKVDEDFLLLKTRTDEIGITHKTYQQVYKGIKLEGVHYMVHGKGDAIEVINGEYVPIALNTVSPTLSGEEALQRAIQFTGAKKYKWEDPALEVLKRTLPNQRSQSYYPKGELVITKDLLGGSGEWKLAYKFTISALEPESEKLVYVDAISGNVIRSTSLLCDANAPGTAQTLYSGTRNIIGDSFSGQFRLREVRNSVNISTLDMNSGTNYASAVDFTDNDNNWTSAEHSANLDQAALDAHWAAEIVLDYWRTVHSRNSINGSGMQVINYVHFNNNWSNAQWDGANNVMRYGDGDGIFTGPLTALDICAHEFGHGINQYEANLAYEGESGALNEGFSDIWGAVIENWADPTKQTWLCGEDIGFPARSMSNPTLFGQPDTRGGTNWFDPTGCTPVLANDFCGVHTNSGVLNYCFFLMAQGGSGTNDLSNAFNVTGMGITSAARIAYRALAFYLGSNSNFADARNAFITAATDLFGTCGPETIATTNAWFAVGVGAAYTAPTLSFDIYKEHTTTACNNFTALAYGITQPITWTTTNGLLVNGNSAPYTTPGYSAEISPSGTAAGFVTATYISPTSFCTYTSNSLELCTCVPWTPAPNFTVIWSNPRPGEPLQAVVDAHPDAIGYNWYLDDVLVESMGQELFGTYDWACGDHGVSVVAVFECGISTPIGDSYWGLCSPFRSSSSTKIYPNPAGSTITIEVGQLPAKESTLSKGTKAISRISSIRVFDKLGNLKLQKTYSPQVSRTAIDVTALSSDLYYIEISDGKNSTRMPLLVKH